jgi:hypothetical protein
VTLISLVPVFEHSRHIDLILRLSRLKVRLVSLLGRSVRACVLSNLPAPLGILFSQFCRNPHDFKRAAFSAERKTQLLETKTLFDRGHGRSRLGVVIERVAIDGA